jgi:hypothetical protein
MSGRRNEAFPQSGVPGILWSKPHGKWKARHTVDGVAHYLGLYDDLDEAKRVKAAAVLEHGYKHETGGRGHENSTSHLSDAELTERFALDDEGDPAWREKPLVGSEPEIRERARWNSRHAGKKLDPRSSFRRRGGGMAQRLWRQDIVARLVAVRDRGATLDEAISPDELQGGGDAAPEAIPSDELQGSGMPEHGAYEDKLAKAQAVVDPLRREAMAKPLEGEVIPPTPIAKGPLALLLMETKRKFGLNQRDLYVLSGTKDPFGQDSPMGHMLGRWFLVRLDLHAPGRVIHLRGVHYLLVAVQAVKPDGERYQNTKDDYYWLNDRAAKAARWLRYIPFDRIVDERNEEAIISRPPRIAKPISGAFMTTGYSGVDLPAPVAIGRPEPRPFLSGFGVEERFCFAVFGEKSSLSEVLVPFAARHGADLFIAIGELSESRAYQMARDAARDGRKLIVFTFSDFDPSGMQMPVSIAVKLMAHRELQFPTFEFAVVPVALTLEDVIRLRLPTAMVEKKDKRTGMWQATFAPPLIEAGLLTQAEVDQGGLAQVEIDALGAINPTELNRMAEAAIAPYLDPTLAQRADAAKDAWLREAQTALDRGVDRTRLDKLSRAEQRDARSFNRLLCSLQRAKGRIDSGEAAMRVLAEAVGLPPIPKLLDPDGERSETAKPLVDSDWGYLGMVEAMKARKKYEDEG